jgi:hypothetical protein
VLGTHACNFSVFSFGSAYVTQPLKPCNVCILFVYSDDCWPDRLLTLTVSQVACGALHLASSSSAAAYLAGSFLSGGCRKVNQYSNTAFYQHVLSFAGTTVQVSPLVMVSDVQGTSSSS